LIFEFLKTKEVVQIWLYENVSMKMEGVILGFDEYMNIVLDDAVEVNVKTSARRPLGRILLKGDCITLIQRATQLVEESA
jgi:small nuclear ribonucleoprotein E